MNLTRSGLPCKALEKKNESDAFDPHLNDVNFKAHTRVIGLLEIKSSRVDESWLVLNWREGKIEERRRVGKYFCSNTAKARRSS